MTKFAEHFATIVNGEISLLAQAYPPHELLPNQIMLTLKEYNLLKSVRGIDEARALLNSVEYKIWELEDLKVESLGPAHDDSSDLPE